MKRSLKKTSLETFKSITFMKRYTQKEVGNNKIIVSIYDKGLLFDYRTFRKEDKLSIESFKGKSIPFYFHLSDCSVYNEPYKENETCDCGAFFDVDENKKEARIL